MVYSIHVGCENVDDRKYPQNPGPYGWTLPGAAKSAQQMEEIVRRRHAGAETKLLIDKPTVAMLKRALKSILSRIKKRNDRDALIIFTYMGHGATIGAPYGLSGVPNEAVVGNDRDFETTILLWDRMMIAHEFGAMLVQFPQDVTFLSIVDGCGEGAFYFDALPIAELRDGATGVAAPQPPPIAMNPGGILQELYKRHPQLYDKLAKNPGTILLRLIYFGACKVGETTFAHSDGTGGFFSRAIHEVMTGKTPSDTYEDLKERVSMKLHTLSNTMGVPPTNPQLYPKGSARPADLQRAPFC